MNDISPNAIESESVTTGQAARLCSVAPNTVLRWIREGKLKAERTVGGHHRIPRTVLSTFLQSRVSGMSAGRSQEDFQYCWEFHSQDGAVNEDCLQCLVYRSRSARCFELVNLPAGTGHMKVHCSGSCSECEYYDAHRENKAKVLIVTGESGIRDELEGWLGDDSDRIRFAENEYQCSVAIGAFDPDYVVIDQAIGVDRSMQLALNIKEDQRLPFARIVLVGKPEEFPAECKHVVHAFVTRPRDNKALAALIGRLS